MGTPWAATLFGTPEMRVAARRDAAAIELAMRGRERHNRGSRP
jgi:hypothetical protein